MSIQLLKQRIKPIYLLQGVLVVGFAHALLCPGISPVLANEETRVELPGSVQSLVRQLQRPQGFLILAMGLGFIALQMQGSKNQGKLATARWAGGVEKQAAKRVAMRQINERRRDGLTTWINSPTIMPLMPPRKKGGTICRYQIRPQDSTLFIPDGQRGTAVNGGPGCGKTYTVINPQIHSVLEQGFPVVLYDFKYPAQAECHVTYARKLGYEVKIFAPGFPESESCNLIDFLRNPDDGETAAQIAKTLNKNFTLNGGKGGDDPFFQMSGDQLIKAVIQLAKSGHYPDFLTCQKILAIEPTELIDRVKAAAISPWIKVSWEQFMSMRSSEKTSASVVSTASLLFSNFVSPDILPCLCGKSSIPLDLEGKQMLVFGMDQNRRDVVGPILAAVLHMIVVRNVAKQRRDPLAVFLDELPTIYLPSLVNWLNESRSAGFCGVLGFQNLSQLEKAWGKETARAILSGCNTKFIFNPGELDSAKYFSEYLGDQEIHFKQKSKSYQKNGNSRSVGDQDRTRRLIAPDELLKLKKGHFIFINPAYENKREANIPLKLTVRIGKGEQAKEAFAKRNFTRLREQIIAERATMDITTKDLRLREADMDRLIPKPSDKDQKGGTGTVNQMINDLAAPALTDMLLKMAEEFDREDNTVLEAVF